MVAATHTWQEIVSQPQTWRSVLDTFTSRQAALEGFLAQVPCDRIVTTGCGSTHYLAQAAAATLAHVAGIPARAFPASELWLFPAAMPVGRTLLVAISRSGTTTETLWALERFREVGQGAVLAVTCYSESVLAQKVDLVLVAEEAQEQSVAQTRSFSSMFLLTQALAATLAHNRGTLERLRRLPDVLEDMLERVGNLPRRLGEDLGIEQFFFLGGGPLYGLACEAMLKSKEMSLTYAEAYHPLEFRHGPMSMVNERTLVVGLLSDTGLAEEIRVLRDMKALGARILVLAEDGAPLAGSEADHVVELRSGLDEWERGVLYLPLLQQMACHRAIAKGLDPDHPTNLAAVVKL